MLRLTAQWLVGAWWLDSVGSLSIVYFLIKESGNGITAPIRAKVGDDFAFGRFDP